MLLYEPPSVHDSSMPASSWSPHEAIDAYVPPYFLQHPLPLREDSDAHLSAKPSVVSDADEVRPDTKQQLLAALHGQPEHRAAEVAEEEKTASVHTSRPEEEAAGRLKEDHCDAAHILYPNVMVRLVSMIFSNRAMPGGGATVCVRSIDLQHTYFGPVGPNGPPLRFDTNGNPLLHESDVRFFPDERRHGERTSQRVLDSLAARSLALAYICPLLWVPGAERFRISVLKCANCSLGDSDARAIALVLRKRRSKKHICVLEHLDLSFNNITDVGAQEIKKAIKYNRHITTIYLIGNPIRDNSVLKKIENRLARNREGKGNLTLMQRLKWMVKGR